MKREESVVLLGLKLSHNLSWGAHVNDVVLACKRRLGVFYRTFKDAPSSVEITVAGVKGDPGTDLNQLNTPTDVTLDQ
ncbi:unnamed protein product [Didymodactylos carnosus]|uniref:Uncharacterized protein n=1 Tax=Didymodactylos carnosus TaxID=1234261 RepID=A0A814QSY1_9BILA|nr:unnamed protein product [Didymodactylos carnosus]CAF3887307.1 unnamed protein product [Didymodactylos carnosus]